MKIQKQDFSKNHSENLQKNYFLDLLSIDLAGNPKNPSGFAFFDSRRRIRTGVVYSDEEILKLAERKEIIGIDAPLSLPKGRKNIDDKKGPHFRECDKELKRMRIPFFPITLGPMRMLTKRGMGLAKKLKKRGKKVIEIYPGASLELLGLPRKKPEEVNRFLEPFNSKAKTIDESDAAIGLFTIYLWKKGHSYFIGKKDGKILLPKPTIYLGKMREARFLKKINRFVLLGIKGGKKVKIYKRDTGQMKEYLKKGRKLFVIEKKGGKLSYLLRAVEYKGERIMADPLLDNKMALLWLRKEGIKGRTTEVKRGRSTFDLSWKDCIAEVKGANMHYKEGMVFPDVRSNRAERQFKKLTGLSGCRYIIFISHGKCSFIGINPEMEELAKIIKKGIEKGVKVKAVSTIIDGNYWIGEREIKFYLYP